MEIKKKENTKNNQQNQFAKPPSYKMKKKRSSCPCPPPGREKRYANFPISCRYHCRAPSVRPSSLEKRREEGGKRIKMPRGRYVDSSGYRLKEEREKRRSFVLCAQIMPIR